MAFAPRQDRQDAERARQLVEAALDRGSPAYREQGADHLLRAAQVYATLSLRPPN